LQLQQAAFCCSYNNKKAQLTLTDDAQLTAPSFQDGRQPRYSMLSRVKVLMRAATVVRRRQLRSIAVAAQIPRLSIVMRGSRLRG